MIYAAAGVRRAVLGLTLGEIHASNKAEPQRSLKDARKVRKKKERKERKRKTRPLVSHSRVLIIIGTEEKGGATSYFTRARFFFSRRARKRAYVYGARTLGFFGGHARRELKAAGDVSLLLGRKLLSTHQRAEELTSGRAV